MIHFEKVLSGGTNGRKKSRQDGYYLLKIKEIPSLALWSTRRRLHQYLYQSEMQKAKGILKFIGLHVTVFCDLVILVTY